MALELGAISLVDGFLGLLGVLVLDEPVVAFDVNAEHFAVLGEYVLERRHRNRADYLQVLTLGPTRQVTYVDCVHFFH